MAQAPRNAVIVAVSGMQALCEAIVRRAFDDVRVHCRETIEGGLRVAGALTGPQLILLGLDLPRYTGIEALAHWLQELPRIRPAVIAGAEERGRVVPALKAGAAGYINATSPRRTIIAALRLIAIGGIYIPTQCVHYLEATAPEEGSDDGLTPKLTDRKRQVLRLLLDGRRNRQIAQELDITEGTVKQHTFAIYEAMGVKSRGELFALAARGGIRRDGSSITKGI